MNSITSIKFQTVIKVLYMLVAASCLVYATAWANPVAPPRPTPQPTAPQTPYPAYGQPPVTGEAEAIQRCSLKFEFASEGYYTCLANHRTGGGSQELKNKCNEDVKAIDKGLEALNKFCGDYISTNDGRLKRECTEKLKTCVGGKSPTDDVSAVGSLVNVLGFTREQSKRNCTMKEQNYHTRREKYQEKIKKLTEDIKTARLDMTKADKERDEAIEGIQKEMVQAQEDFDKLVKDMEERTIQLEKEALEREQNAVRTVRSAETKKSELQEALQKAVYETNIRLIDASRQVAADRCMTEVQTFVQGQKLQKKGSLNSLTAQRKAVQEQANLKFNVCIQKFEKVREEEARRLDSLQKTTESQIQNLDGEIQMANEVLKAGQVERQKRIEQMEQEKQKAIAKAMQNTQMLQAKLQSVQKQAQEKKSTLMTTIAQLMSELSVAQGQLQALGSEPDEGDSNDKALSDWLKEFNTGQGLAKSFVEKSGCCHDGNGKPLPGIPSLTSEHPRCKIFRNYSEDTPLKIPSGSTK